MKNTQCTNLAATAGLPRRNEAWSGYSSLRSLVGWSNWGKVKASRPRAAPGHIEYVFRPLGATEMSKAWSSQYWTEMIRFLMGHEYAFCQDLF